MARELRCPCQVEPDVQCEIEKDGAEGRKGYKAMKKAFFVPYTFVLLNWAAVAGLYYFVRGYKNVWKDIWVEESPSDLRLASRPTGVEDN